jgi:S-adenosylmethionine synthetase
MNIKTAEFVSPKHPDKTCDRIADKILDNYLKKDRYSRTAIEVMGGHNKIVIIGEIKSKAKISKKEISDIIYSLVRKRYELIIKLVEQSPEIARGVEIGGAGDQGIMVGYATRETPNFMPLEYEHARDLCQKIYRKYPFDGKTQVTIDGKHILRAVASFQNAPKRDLEKLTRSLIKAEEYFINPAGDWHIGGFDADTGLTGRKMVVDSYGPRIPIGGGCFSGKDPSKVDRSAAYMARKIAVTYLKKYKAQEVLVKLAYAIGQEEPLMREAIVDGKEIQIKDFDLTPLGIIKTLDLRKPIYSKTCEWGHFGNNFQWDK